MPNEKEEISQAEILTPKQVQIIIPQCCLLGLPSCTHVPKRQRQVKTNIGL